VGFHAFVFVMLALDLGVFIWHFEMGGLREVIGVDAVRDTMSQTWFITPWHHGNVANWSGDDRAAANRIREDG
jgi:hypothetical protein